MGQIRARFLMEWTGFRLEVDLQLSGHGITAIFGPSGSGKTTLLRCIAGLEKSAQGFLEFNGETWQNRQLFMPVHKRPIGYVFQEASLFPHLTVLDNLRYGQKRAAEKIVSLDQVVALLGIGHLLERRPERLSGGERQRVGIARALAVSPRLLLMDEPLAALDLARKQEILPYLERLHDELDIPVLYVTHAPDEVARLADHLVVMDAGLVTAVGPLPEILSSVDLPIRIGEEREVVLDAVIGEIDAEWHLARMDFEGGSLWARDRGIDIGRRVRVRVPASGVSLALQPAEQSSVINSLPGQVEAIGEAEHPGLCLVKVRVGAVSILSRVTRRSLAGLQIEPGKVVWVQIKSAAVIE